MNKPLTFYFDYLSPYAFLAWRKIRELCQSYEIELKAKGVLFGAILSHWNSLGPAEIPPKRQFVFLDILRWARFYQLDIKGPPAHPFNPLLPLRVTCLMENEPCYFDLISTIFDDCWVGGKDITQPDYLETLLCDFGIDNGVYKALETRNKQLLKDNTSQAIKEGVFGVPTMLIGQEFYWGHDQIPFIEKYLQDPIGVDSALLQEILDRPAAIERKR